MTLRIVALGAGGVGGFFGGLMAAAGAAEVAFVARGAHLEAMRRGGLTIERDGGRPPVRLPRPVVAEDPAALGPADVVILGVKLADTDAAIGAARRGRWWSAARRSSPSRTASPRTTRCAGPSGPGR